MSLYNAGLYNAGAYDVGVPPGTFSGLGVSLRRAIVSGDGAVAPKILGRWTQEPGEVLDYDFDYSAWFIGRLDTPESATVLADLPLSVLGFELRPTPKIVKVILGGAVDGSQSKVTCRLSTNAGIVKEAEFMVKGKAV